MRSFFSILFILSLLLTGKESISYATPVQDARMQLLENHVTDLQDMVRELTGRLEELEHKHKLAQTHQETLPLEPRTPLASLSPASSVSPSSKPSTSLSLAVKDQPQTIAHYNEALELLKANHFPKALIEFQQFEKTYPASPLRGLALYWIGVIYFIQERHSDAVQAFDSLLRQEPQSPKKYDVLYKMAKSYRAMGATNEARQTIKNCLRSLEKDPQKHTFKTVSAQAYALAKELEAVTSHEAPRA